MEVSDSDERPVLVTVDQCLGLAELDTARVLVRGRLDARVKWAAVIEWPVENFVNEGDFVLSFGAGRTTSQLRELVEHIADSGAAAVGLAAGPGALPHLGEPCFMDRCIQLDVGGSTTGGKYPH